MTLSVAHHRWCPHYLFIFSISIGIHFCLPFKAYESDYWVSPHLIVLRERKQMAFRSIAKTPDPFLFRKEREPQTYPYKWLESLSYHCEQAMTIQCSCWSCLNFFLNLPFIPLKFIRPLIPIFFIHCHPYLYLNTIKLDICTFLSFLTI